MFDLPKTSEIRKPLHKKLIYEKYAAELSGNKKDKFDADISRMIITNEISEASVNIKATEEVSSIFVLQVELKTKEYDDKNIVMISKLFGQKLLIVLHYENAYQLAINETRLLKSDWKNEEEISLKEMCDVWQKPLESVFPTKTNATKHNVSQPLYRTNDIYVCKNKVAVPKVFIPVIPGTNCEYDSAKAFRRAGAEVETLVFKNQSESDILESVDAFEKAISQAQIIMFPGGFSAGD